MTLAVLDKVAEKIKLATPTMRKGSLRRQEALAVILHPTR
jgi:hypothetical protein